MLPLLCSLTSVIVISLISILAIYRLIFTLPSFTQLVLPLVGLAVGSLLGDAFIHILPSANLQISNPTTVSFLTILGILIFFLLEKIIRVHHCHDPNCPSPISAIIPVSLAGEALHNFIDGIIISTSFITNFSLGLATSLAVLIHEIPHEIGHFCIYAHQGLNLRRSLYLNLLAATTSLVGVVVASLLGHLSTTFSAYMLPIAAGGFIYLAASDLIPELHRHLQSMSSTIWQFIFVVAGVALMSGLLWLE